MRAVLEEWTTERTGRAPEREFWHTLDALVGLQRIAGSIKRGWIVPSLLITRMATDPRPDRTAKALREYGRIVETNFILRWAGDPVLRRRAHGALNRHENSNALHRAISYGNRGRVRARDPETVQRQFESRRLMANLVIYWNARYMALAHPHGRWLVSCTCN